jgi:uncharacterized membrane protein YcgQ (UPF0703/DUF1980 family)
MELQQMLAVLMMILLLMILSLSRFLFSAVQLALFVYAIQKIGDHKYDFSENEGSKFDVLVAYGTRAGFWVSENGSN